MGVLLLILGAGTVLFSLARNAAESQKVTSDKMSYDDGLLMGRGHYNINYQ